MTEFTAAENGYIDDHYIGLALTKQGEYYGPFESYQALCDWRQGNGLDIGSARGGAREVWDIVPAALVKHPNTYVKPDPKFSGAKFEVHTRSGSTYEVTVRSLNGTKRTKGEWVFPMRSVLHQAAVAEPTEYLN